ncbi:hypothetical protein IJS77_03150 [bacterium]|nr:hypothetical protein [bacterium]
MRINHISNNTSFNSLKINIDKKMLNSPKIKKELTQIKKVFKDNGFSRKRNVNVILTYEKGSGFFGIIESKKQGVPNNPDFRYPISTTKKGIEAFGKWLKEWDYSYSAAGIKRMREIKEKALELMQNKKENLQLLSRLQTY